MTNQRTKASKSPFELTLDAHGVVWGRALLDLHRAICLAHGVSLRPPAIDFADAHGVLGLWKSGPRTIVMSVHLIRERPWDVVEAVFRHEMAHQMVSEVFKSDELHGPLFEKACVILGVPPEFRGARVQEEGLAGLPGWRALGESPNDAKMLVRLEALERIRDGATNEHERDNALLRIHEHLRKHSLDSLKAKGTTEYERLRLRLGSRTVEPWHSSLVSLLRDTCHVETVTSYEFDAASHHYLRVVDVFGTPGGVKHARYVWGCLGREVEARWAAYKKRPGAQTTMHRSFKDALIQGFREKFESLADGGEEPGAGAGAGAPGTGAAGAGVDPSMAALVALARKGTEAYVKSFYPRLRSRYRRSTVRGAAYEAGKAEGRKVSLKTPMESGKGGVSTPRIGPGRGR